MIFSFIQYTQPGWYFNVVPNSKHASTIYYHPTMLPLPKGVVVEEDAGYETNIARYADVGYRAWHMGCLLEAEVATIHQIKAEGTPSLKDEYRFVFKYWGLHWALIALVKRLLSFHNPFTNLLAFLVNLKTKKYNLYEDTIEYASFHHHNSILLQEQPLVSVIIPTLNRYEYLYDVLADLEKQIWQNFDVIIVDQSENLRHDFYQQFKLNIQLVEQKEKLLWTARNRAVKLSKANYLLFFDDDSRVEPDWIEQHMKAIDYFKADISAGVSVAVVGGKVPASYNHFLWADQFDSGNALVKRSVFQQIGLFDLQFNKERMGDGEFGVRAYVNGLKSISNPYAKRVHLKVASGGLREIGHWDGFRPKKLFAPKPVPSVIYLYKKYYPKHLYKAAIQTGIMLSNIAYKNKRKSSFTFFSIILTIVKLPLLVFQYRKSLSLANKKLAQGNKIEWL